MKVLFWSESFKDLQQRPQQKIHRSAKDPQQRLSLLWYIVSKLQVKILPLLLHKMPYF